MPIRLSDIDNPKAMESYSAKKATRLSDAVPSTPRQKAIEKSPFFQEEETISPVTPAFNMSPMGTLQLNPSWLQEKARNWLFSQKRGEQSFPPIQAAKNLLTESVEGGGPAEAARQIVTQNLNTRGFGIPEAALRGAVGGQAYENLMPEQGIPSMIGTLSGVKPSIQAGQTVGKTVPSTVNRARALLGMKALGPESSRWARHFTGLGQTAVEGATTGALLPGDIEDRTRMAKIGALVNVAGKMAAAPIQTVVKGFRKMKAGKPAPDKVVGEQIKTTEDTLKTAQKENIELLKGKIKTTAYKTTRKLQKFLPGFLKEGRTKYGNTIDDISQRLAESGEEITNKEFTEVLQGTVNDLNAAETSSSNAEQIMQIRDKYIRQDPSMKLSVRTVLNEIQAIKGSLSASAKKGIGEAEDFAIGILQKHWGKFVETRLGGLKELNKNYVDFMELAKKSYATFKPRQGALGATKGTQALSALAEGKIGVGEKAAVKALERGTAMAEGAGPVTSRLSALGKELSMSDEQIASYYAPRLKQLGMRQETIDKLLKQKEVPNVIRRMVYSGARDALILSALWRMATGGSNVNSLQ